VKFKDQNTKSDGTLPPHKWLVYFFPQLEYNKNPKTPRNKKTCMQIYQQQAYLIFWVFVIFWALEYNNRADNNNKVKIYMQ
jgi:hypothetical protein